LGLTGFFDIKADTIPEIVEPLTQPSIVFEAAFPLMLPVNQPTEMMMATIPAQRASANIPIAMISVVEAIRPFRLIVRNGATWGSDSSEDLVSFGATSMVFLN
jgi:hypothetical protein